MVADDTTHVHGKLTPEQIGEAIRHKKFGVDMRETIAQAFEYMLSWWDLVQKLDKKFDDLKFDHKQDIEQLQSQITAFKEDYDKQVVLFQQALSSQESQILEIKSDLNNLNVDFRNFLKQYSQDLDGIRNDYNDKFGSQDQRLKKLENAVFGLNTIEIDTPLMPDQSHKSMEEINFDDRIRKDKKW